MPIPVFFIDTFTAKAFQGNPTAVCLAEEALDSQLMLSIAAELNLPVSAFIRPLAAPESYEIRYYTPLMEIPACGHATLAAAQTVLMTRNERNPKFLTASGVEIETFSEPDYTKMFYPKYQMSACPVSRETLDALRLEDYRTSGFCRELEALFIELESPQVLRSIEPDYARLVKSSREISEIVVTSASDEPAYDYLLRSFCPWIGIDEDPVTGSVHAVLAGFWKDRLGKNDLVAYQASERGGELYLTACDDKVELGGKTVRVLEGEITV